MAWFKHLGLVALLGVGAVVLACGSDGGGDDESSAGTNDDEKTGNKPPANEGTLKLLPETSYSGYYEGGDFRVPLKVRNGPVDTWTATDTSALEIQGTPDGATVTVRKAGTFYVTGKGANGTFSAKIVVTAYTQAECDTGRDRYNNGVVALRDADGGVFMPPTMVPTMPPADGMSPFAGIMLDKNAACAYCHGETTTLPLRIRHTPTQVGGYSDDAVTTIFSMGMKPATASQRLLPAEVFAMFHTWQMTDAEKKGILCYLRSLPPADMDPLPGFPGAGGTTP